MYRIWLKSPSVFRIFNFVFKSLKLNTYTEYFKLTRWHLNIVAVTLNQSVKTKVVLKNKNLKLEYIKYY